MQKKLTLNERTNRLVDYEVYANVNGLITAEHTEKIYEAQPEPTEKQIADVLEYDDTATRDDAIEQIRDEFEPLEFWAVSQWLADKLRAEGETVAEFGLTNVWARTTSGQAIAIDYVIEKIVTDSGYAGGE